VLNRLLFHPISRNLLLVKSQYTELCFHLCVKILQVLSGVAESVGKPPTPTRRRSPAQCRPPTKFQPHKRQFRQPWRNFPSSPHHGLPFNRPHPHNNASHHSLYLDNRNARYSKSSDLTLPSNSNPPHYILSPPLPPKKIPHLRPQR
jgi:hypothetical protein